MSANAIPITLALHAGETLRVRYVVTDAHGHETSATLLVVTDAAADPAPVTDSALVPVTTAALAPITL